MSDKLLVLITGANQGLGYYAAQQMSATGKYHILMGSRDLAKVEKAIETITDDKSANANPSNVEPIQIDMSSDESIEAAAKKVEEKYGHLGQYIEYIAALNGH
jgi:NAD(P)-dependent dehydrogenase (short-subunit alcohol dehydrogenase family)